MSSRRLQSVLLTLATVLGIAITPAAASASGLSGSVRTDEGTPVSSAVVAAYDADTGRFADDVLVGLDGRWTLPSLRPGRYAVRFVPFGHSGPTGHLSSYWFDSPERADATTVVVDAATSTPPLDAALHPGAAITGSVTDVTGGGVVGATVAGVDPATGRSFSTTTAADGSYEALGLRAGDYVVSFSHPRGGFVEQTYRGDGTDPTSVTATLGETVPSIDARLAATGAIGGTVTKWDGSGLPGATVEVRRADGRGAAVTSAETGAAGTYRVGGLGAGRYAVHVLPPAGSTYRPVDVAGTTLVQADKTTSGVNARTHDRGEIAGVVTTPDDEPIANIAVAYDDDHTVFTDGAGRYRFQDVPQGDYRVRFSDGQRRYVDGYYPDAALRADATTVTTGPGNTADGIDLQLRPGAQIAGHVADADGAAIAYADVTAEPVGPGASVATTSDFRGDYRLAGLRAGTYVVHFEHRSFGARYWGDAEAEETAERIVLATGAERTGIDQTLTDGREIRGTVVDEDGDPAPGVGVDVEGPSPRSTTTKSDGTYVLTGLDAGEYVVRFTGGPGYVTGYHPGGVVRSDATPVTVATGAPVSGIDHALVRTASVAGAVTKAADATALSGATVTVRARAGAIAGTATTGSDGSWRVEGLRPGSYVVGFGAPTFADVWWQDAASAQSATDVTLAAGAARTGVDQAMADGRAISGTVRDEHGNPSSGVSVSLEGANYRSTSTAADGTYAFSDLPAGQYRVRIQPSTDHVSGYYPGATTYAKARVLEIGSGPGRGIDFALVPGANISGRLTTAVGGPAAYVSVNASSYDGTAGGYASTNANGEYTLRGLAAGRYNLQFSGSGYARTYWPRATTSADAETVRVAAAERRTGVDDVLVPGGTITGRVTGPDGAALPYYAYGAVYDANDPTTQVSSVSIDQTGKYTVSGLPAGSYLLFVGAPSGSDAAGRWYGGAATAATATPIVLGAGATVADRDLQLPRKARISGAVSGPEGPLAGASVVATKVGGNSYDSDHRVTATTATDGSYLLAGLADARYSLRFAPAYEDEDRLLPVYDGGVDYADEATGVRARTGEVVMGVDASLRPGGTISGTIRDADGPLEGVEVQASPRDYDDDSRSAYATTDADGRYMLTGLAPNRYAISAYATGGYGWMDRPGTVALEPHAAVTGIDLEFRLAPGGVVRGTITGPDGPAEGTSVRIDSIDGDRSYSTMTGDGGTYEYGGVAPGEYVVAAGGGGGSDPFLSAYFDGASGNSSPTGALPVAVTAGGEQVADLHVARGATITGTVRDGAHDPVPYVDIDVYDARGHRVGYGYAESDGSYGVAGLRSGSYRLRFTASRRARVFNGGAARLADATPITATAPGTSSGNDVVLGPLLTDPDPGTDPERRNVLSGVVTDADGIAVAGASVTLYRGGGSSSAYATTDGEGRWRAGNLGDDDYRVSVFAPGFTSRWFGDATSFESASAIHLAGGVARTDADVILGRGGEIAGRVTGPGGRPARSSSVSVYRVTDGVYWSATGSLATDADGEYRIRGLEAGRYRVFFGPDSAGRTSGVWLGGSRSMEGSDTVEVPASGVVRADQELPGGGSVAGTVSDADGDPISSGYVYAYDASGMSLAGTPVSAGGSYLLRGLPAGGVRLQFTVYGAQGGSVYSGGAATLAAATVVPTSVGTTTWGTDAQLRRPGRITGLVVDGDGTPLHRAKIEIATAYCCGGVTGAYTDANGRFAASPGDGSFTVRVTPPAVRDELHAAYAGAEGSSATSYTVAGGADTDVGTVTLPGPASGGITGLVRADDGGALLSGIGVHAIRRDGEGDGDEGQVDGVTGEDGRYTLRGLAAGSWWVSFDEPAGRYAETWLGGYAGREQSTPVEVESGTASVPEQRLDAGASVEGTVVGDDDALSNASVTVESDDGAYRFASTNESGRWSVRGLHHGSYRVRFAADGYVSQALGGGPDDELGDAVVLTAGQRRTGVNANLVRSGSVSGTLIAPDDANYYTAEVEAFDEEGQSIGSTYVGAYGDGAWSIDGLPTGPVRIAFERNGERSYYDHAGTLATATRIPVRIGEDTGGVDAPYPGLTTGPTTTPTAPTPPTPPVAPTTTTAPTTPTTTTPTTTTPTPTPTTPTPTTPTPTTPTTTAAPPTTTTTTDNLDPAMERRATADGAGGEPDGATRREDRPPADGAVPTGSRDAPSVSAPKRAARVAASSSWRLGTSPLTLDGHGRIAVALVCRAAGNCPAGTVAVRSTSSRRVLARGTVSIDRRGRRLLRTTAAGRAALRRGRDVRVRVEIGPGSQTVAVAVLRVPGWPLMRLAADEAGPTTLRPDP